MASALAPSELILNADGSIYHLGLHPEHVAPIVITVGDPERVALVSSHFDAVDIIQQRREFCTHVGRFAGRRIMCISTGIGTDNIDIVLNELDALVNVDFSSRKVRADFSKLTFIRLGTSGTFQADVPVDSLLLSAEALGLDGLGPSYDFARTALAEEFGAAYPEFGATCYAAPGSARLLKHFNSIADVVGTTLTCAGFYGPQRRSIRLPFRGPDLQQLAAFRYSSDSAAGGSTVKLDNFEMETAGIYALAAALGHDAVSVSALLANRATGVFSADPAAAVSRMISKAMELIRELPN